VSISELVASQRVREGGAVAMDELRNVGLLVEEDLKLKPWTAARASEVESIVKTTFMVV
jgi:hypothetical protein